MVDEKRDTIRVDLIEFVEHELDCERRVKEAEHARLREEHGRLREVIEDKFTSVGEKLELQRTNWETFFSDYGHERDGVREAIARLSAAIEAARIERNAQLTTLNRTWATIAGIITLVFLAIEAFHLFK